MSDATRKTVIRIAGILVILIGLGAILLPEAPALPPPRTIGWMLVATGLLELASAAARWAHRPTAVIAGAATLAAGLRLELDPSAGFFEVLNLVILWLVVRAAALGLAAFRTRDRLGAWIALAAGTDFLLAVALLAGLPIALIVVGLFGPSQPVTATFAWVLGLSFIADGALLLATASLEGRNSRPPAQASAG